MHKPVKSLGQNFLNSPKVVELMLNALDISKEDMPIIEIGPGMGVLTQELVTRTSSKIYCVEIDPHLVSLLTNKFAMYPNVSVVEANVLKWLPLFTEGSTKVLGSLPYYITSPILHALIYMDVRPVTCVLMVQKEVGEKVAADAPDASYLSAFVQTFYNVQYLGTVPKTAFNPQPKVDSAVIKLTSRNRDLDLSDVRKYEGFLHKGFSNPRKMINKAFSQEELKKGKIDSSIRPQNLSADQWFEFFSFLRSHEI